METQNTGFKSDKIIKPKSGGLALVLYLFTLFILLGVIIACIVLTTTTGNTLFVIGMLASILLITIISIALAGLKIVKPNEARVFTLFGKYYGVIKEPGFYFVHPFVSSAGEKVPRSEKEIKALQGTSNRPLSDELAFTINPRISLKTRTLLNNKQKINDELGNPIEISIAVTWKIICPTMALFNVENCNEYLSIQCDSALRNIVRSYPYDVSQDAENKDEKTLRGSSTEIAEKLQHEIQSVVQNAGIEIIDAKITHLAYAPEIAAAMLQRQQASAIVDARQMIVEGAVSMVDMALQKLANDNIVALDDERKAQMVSNLMVVLCGNKDAQPIVNSGSLY